jgi:hypothetical protein
LGKIYENKIKVIGEQNHEGSDSENKIEAKKLNENEIAARNQTQKEMKLRCRRKTKLIEQIKNIT